MLLSSIYRSSPELGALDHSLQWVDQHIAETAPELEQALADFDQAAIARIGAKLRGLEARRQSILRQIDGLRGLVEAQKADEARSRRPGVLRRLSEVEPRIREAAAFDADPSRLDEARLRGLTIEKIQLSDELNLAQEAAETQ